MNSKRTDQTRIPLTQDSNPGFDRAIDQILGNEDEIVPSSGFLASVMERVQEEAAVAAAPTPIPFPWRRAIPGILLAAAVLGWSGLEFARGLAADWSLTGLSMQVISAPVIPASAFRDLEAASWVVGALLTSLLSWLLSSRLARKSGLL
jgi:hypothetical protein